MKNCVLIEYLKEQNRVVDVVNIMTGNSYSRADDVQYYEVTKCVHPGLNCALCCAVGSVLLILCEEKYKVTHDTALGLLKLFVGVANQRFGNKRLSDMQVCYAILDSSGEYDSFYNVEALENDIINVGGVDVGVFSIAYNEDNMPHLLDGDLGCKVLRDFSAWKLAGTSLRGKAGSCYAACSELDEWSADIAKHSEETFEPCVFTRERNWNAMAEIFAEWEMEAFIRKVCEAAYQAGRNHK